MLSTNDQKTTSSQHFSYRAFEKLETDFPFLFDVIEFRIFLYGISDLAERKEYVDLWVKRKKYLATLSPEQLKKEGEKYAKTFKLAFDDVRNNEREQFIKIHTSSLKKDLRYLTRYKLSGRQLAELEEQIFLELINWINNTPDDVIARFLVANIREFAAREASPIPEAFWFYYEQKGIELFCFLKGERFNKLKEVSISGRWSMLGIRIFATLPSHQNKRHSIYTTFNSIVLAAGAAGVASIVSASLGFDYIFFACCAGTLIGTAGIMSWVDTRKIRYQAARVGPSFKYFEQLANSLFKDVIKNSLAAQEQKEHKANVEYTLADLPTLMPILSFYLSPAPVVKKKKEKTRPGSVSESAPEPEVKSNNETSYTDISDVEKGNKYFFTENKKYIKLNKSDLDKTYTQHFPRVPSTTFIQKVFSTVKRDRKLDVLSQSEQKGKKAKYKKCTHKLRLDYNPSLRIGFISRLSNVEERKLGIDSEVYSPRLLREHNGRVTQFKR